MAIYSTLTKLRPLQCAVPVLRKSSSLSNAYARQITNHISLRNTEKTIFDESNKPLVLLYCWLGAKAKHIDKFQNFYLDKGFDVASIKVSYNDILQPSKSQRIADDVISFTTEHNPNSPVLAHCFSVGAYMYSEALVKINADQNYRDRVGNRIFAQVYDSPVDLDVIPTGMANATTQNKALNTLIKSTIRSYLYVSSPWVTKHYLKASRAFKENKLEVPSLFLYSEKDPVCFPDLLQKIINDFQNLNIDVWGHCWKDSKHVSHYHQYPDEYIDLLEQLLKHAQLTLK